MPPDGFEQADFAMAELSLPIEVETEVDPGRHADIPENTRIVQANGAADNASVIRFRGRAAFAVPSSKETPAPTGGSG